MGIFLIFTEFLLLMLELRVFSCTFDFVGQSCLGVSLRNYSFEMFLSYSLQVYILWLRGGVYQSERLSSQLTRNNVSSDQF
jgi:hypothetical protein